MTTHDDVAVERHQRVRVLSINLCLMDGAGNLRYHVPMVILVGALCALGVSLLSAALELPLWQEVIVLALAIVFGAPNCSLLFAMIMERVPGLQRFQQQYKRERVDLLLQHLVSSGCDVCCVQECTTLWCSTSLRDYLLARAKEAGFEHSALSPAGPSFPATFANSGLLVLSRLRVTDSAFVAFKHQVVCHSVS